MIFYNPLIGFITFLFKFITLHYRFNKKIVGRTIIYNGDAFKIFRRVTVKQWFSNKKPSALFVIRFTPDSRNVEENIKYSKFAMMIFMGFRGFRSKYWCVNYETGECMGVYEWQNLKAAKNYTKSIAIKNMTKRSIEGSISYKIYNLNDNSKTDIIKLENRGE